MRKLQSLDLWRTAQELAQTTYTLSNDPKLAKHFALLDQLRRAALSVPANIAEGYALGSTPQFIRCLKISLGSAAELVSHLSVLQALHIIGESEVGRCLSLCDRVVSMTIALIRNLMRRQG